VGKKGRERNANSGKRKDNSNRHNTTLLVQKKKGGDGKGGNGCCFRGRKLSLACCIPEKASHPGVRKGGKM